MRKDLIWVHGASIGEIISVVPLIEALKKEFPSKRILITTHTASSKEVLSNVLKIDFEHVFLPVRPSKILRFYQPSLVLWIESEFIPWYLFSIKKLGVPIYLINARMSNTSFKRWKVFRFFFKSMLRVFDMVFPQSYSDLSKFSFFQNKKIRYLGNLKFMTQAIYEKIEQEDYMVDGKALVTCTSTHHNEEQILIKIFPKLEKEVLLVIIPRHIKRIKKIMTILKNANLSYSLWSEIGSLEEIGKKSQVLLVDKNGYNKFFCSISKVVFLGKTISKYRKGGQTPIEPLVYGRPIIFGPYYHNFYDVCNDLVQRKIGYEVSGVKGLVNNISFLLKNEALLKEIRNNSYAYLEEERKVLQNYMEFFTPLLMSEENE